MSHILVTLLIVGCGTPALADYGHAAGTLLPDRTVTPGMAFTVDVTFLCAKGFTTKSIRHTTAAMKREVYRRYHANPKDGVCASGCEVDHLIPLTAGGADDLMNLWPQPAEPKPGFHEKDKLENWMHRQACKKAETDVQAATNWLIEAQAKIAADWTALYAEMNKR